MSEQLDELYATLEKFSLAVSDFEEYIDNEGAVALRAFMIEIKVREEIRLESFFVHHSIGSFGRTIIFWYS